ncbi:MAG TPA: type II toxin-antitoxin system VapC family toxin [Acidimicrobiales bacterium]|jgi:predicted nucleic acid-binding protein|nr:type II toxin-antitoxin system VapC family toxin [Acidimicrobiales bacterium]
MAAAYVDSSALVKLVVEEPESAALRRHLRRRSPLVASALVRTEVVRAVLPQGEGAVARAQAVLSLLELIRVNDEILRAAGTLLPPEVRSLDAIHLAAVVHLGRDVASLVTYDERMTAAARALKLRPAAPT